MIGSADESLSDRTAFKKRLCERGDTEKWEEKPGSGVSSAEA